MMNNKIEIDLKFLDETVAFIKVKNNQASFNIKALQKFEFIFFQCLNIVRYELQITSQISDFTAEAITQLFVFQAFEYYYKDFPETYEKSTELFRNLFAYNSKLKNDELGTVGVKNKNWVRYFNKIIPQLIGDNI